MDCHERQSLGMLMQGVKRSAILGNCHLTLDALLQVLDGADGAKAVDDLWPAFHKSEVHATPIMVDFDYDGIMDILLATNDGELLFIKDTVSCTQHAANFPSDTLLTLRIGKAACVPEASILSSYAELWCSL